MQTGSQSRFAQQSRKIFCAYHKTEFLTNFCVHKNCLMPLCPSCIVDHTEQHYRQHSKPLYMNLHDALNDVKQSCLNNIKEFEDYAFRLKDMAEFKRRLVQEVHAQLVEHKQNIYAHLERLFTQYEKDVYNIVVGEFENEGLYVQDRINEYELRVHQTMDELYSKLGLIKGEQCLAALIMYYGEERERVTEVKGECEGFINRHQGAKFDTFLNEMAMKDQLHELYDNTIEIKRIANSRKRYEPIVERNERTPEKSRLSNSRKSRIFNKDYDSNKYVSPQRQQDGSIRREKLARDSGYR